VLERSSATAYEILERGHSGVRDVVRSAGMSDFVECRQ